MVSHAFGGIWRMVGYRAGIGIEDGDWRTLKSLHGRNFGDGRILGRVRENGIMTKSFIFLSWTFHTRKSSKSNCLS